LKIALKFQADFYLIALVAYPIRFSPTQINVFISFFNP